MQRGREYRHEEAIVDVAQQLVSDIGVGYLRSGERSWQ